MSCQGCYHSNNVMSLSILILSTIFAIFVLFDPTSFNKVVNASAIQDNRNLTDLLKNMIVNYNKVNESTLQDNPVVVWNLFTANASLEHDLSPPRLARAYALVHISIYDALISSQNLQADNNFPYKDKAIVAGAASEVLSYLFPEMTDKINKFSLMQIMQNKNLSKNYNLSAFALLHDYPFPNAFS